MASPVCCWESSLSWCMCPVHHKVFSCKVPTYAAEGDLNVSFLPLHSLSFPCSQLLFVVGFTVFLANCVDYDILFANKFVNHTDSSKVTLPDAFLPMNVCSARWV